MRDERRRHDDERGARGQAAFGGRLQRLREGRKHERHHLEGLSQPHLIAQQAAVHHWRRAQAHFAELRRVIEGSAVGKRADLPEEAVDATW